MKILIAEDEKAMSDALAAVLKHFGYEVDAVYDGLAATEKARENSYSCIIFDIMMPKIDGIEALKRIRDSGDMTPVIMLTAKSEVEDRIMGLDAGADDYLAKPFAMGELLARIRSMTRRIGEFTPTKLKKGDVELDVAEQELSCTSSVRLSSKETKLLSYLMMNEGKLFLPMSFSAMSGVMKRTWISASSGCIFPTSEKKSRPFMEIYG